MNRSHTKLHNEINTVDWEIFTLQILHPLNFRIKIFRHSTILQRSAYTCFNFLHV